MNAHISEAPAQPISARMDTLNDIAGIMHAPFYAHGCATLARKLGAARFRSTFA